VIWWSVLFGVTFAVMIARPMAQLRRLRNSAATTTGTITAKTDHNGIRYEFSVNKSQYFGISRTGLAGIPLIEDIRIGDSASVCYLPRDPNVNALGDVGALLEDQEQTTISLACFIAFAVIFVFAWNNFFPRRSIAGISLAPVNRFLFGD